LQEIIQRHSILRTSFHEDNGHAVQIVHPTAELEWSSYDLTAEASDAGSRSMEELANECISRPFDLSIAPLLRARLVRINSAEHVLVLTAHHIVSDGWSQEIFLREIMALYERFSQGRPSPLPALKIQYGDYAVWQRNSLRGEVLEKQLAYWRQKLAHLPALELPADRPRPAVPSHSGGMEELRIPAQLTARLRELCRFEQVSPFMALVAAFQIVLGRWTGQDDVSVGSPAANRSRAELENLIGYFVNQLVLRADLSGNPTFREMLKQVRKTCLEAYTNQELPFDMLVKELGAERNMQAAPLLQAVFAWSDHFDFCVEQAGVVMTPMTVNTRPHSRFDLLLSLYGGKDELRGSMIYATDLFEAETMRRMLGHLQRVLEQMVEDPERKIGEFELMGPAELRQVVETWNDTAIPYDRERCLPELIEMQVAATPQAIAVEFGGQRVTYQELNQRANQLAFHLRRLGVGPEVRVGVCMNRSAEMVIAVLGILKAGGAYVPMEPSFPPVRIQWILSSLHIFSLVTQTRHLPLLHELEPQLPELEEVICLDGSRQPEDAISGRVEHWHYWTDADLQSLPAENLARAIQSDNTAYVIFTSGSTGLPKGVVEQHRPVINLIEWITTTFKVGPQDRLLFVASLCFDLSVYDIFGLLAVGGTVVVASEEEIRDPERLLQKIHADRITFWDSAPAALQQLVPFLARDGGHDTASVFRLVFLSGDWIPLAMPDQLRAAFPNLEVVGLGGATEATVWSNFFRIREVDPSWASIPYGKPIQNSRYHVLDSNLNCCPVGVAGDLYIGGECLSLGYSNEPVLTAQKYIPDRLSGGGQRLYRTGDMARYRADGNIEFLGRLDHQVKIRGFRIELGEIESALLRHKSVSAVVVIARGEKTEKRLVAYLVAGGDEQPGSQELREYLKKNVPEYMVPGAFLWLKEMPVTANGKLDRKALPEPGYETETGQSYEEPRTATERVLAELWAQILGVERVGVHDDFFERGGHSLLAAQMVGRVRELLGADIKLRSLFLSPVLADFAVTIDQHRQQPGSVAASEAVPLVDRSHPLELSFAQQRLWFIDQLEPGSAAYNIPVAVRLEGRLDTDALEKSLHEIVRRHEILRTRYETMDGYAIQCVEPECEIPLLTEDLSGVPEQDRLAVMLRRAEEEGRRLFDLRVAPMLRARVLRLAEQDHVLLLTMHHIASDGWSAAVLMTEMVQLYKAFTSGSPSPLPDLKIQYADYAAWQRKWLQGEVLEQQLGYWREQLSDLPSLELPTDHPRPLQPSRASSSQSLHLSAELTQKLQELCRAEGATLFMAVLAAWQIVLGRWSRQHDIVIGTDVANRGRAELEPLIGYFVNQVVLRVSLSGDPAFRQLLGRVREMCLNAYDHQDVPFERVVEELAPDRDLSRNPLFQVIFVWENIPGGGRLEAPGLKASIPSVDPGTVKFDLKLTVSESEHGLYGAMSYSTDLFEASSVRRMLRQLERVLEQMAANPEQHLAEVDVLDEAERQLLLMEWNQTSRQWPPEVCAQQMFEEQAERRAAETAVVCEEQRLSYQELNRRANQLGHYLAEMGVGPEMRVGICMERSVEMVVAILAVLKAGGAYVPLEPGYPVERLGYMVENAQAAVLLTQERLRERLPVSWAQVISVDQEQERERIGRQSGENLEKRTRQENLAYVIYTSGSTGEAKGVGIEHRQLVNYVRGVVEEMGMKEGEKLALVSTFAADLGNTVLYPSLCCGGELHVISAERAGDGRLLAEYFEREKVECVKITPSQLKALLSGGGRKVLPCRRLVLGGEAWSWEWLEELGGECEVMNHYGPTECTVGAVAGPVERNGNGKEAAAGEMRSARSGNVPLGRPLKNVQVYVLDARMKPVGVGMKGELYIGGAGVGRGYLQRAGMTADRFIPDGFSGVEGARLYRTGDVVRWLEEGKLEYVGRSDEQVKIRGYRIEPGEVAAVLEQQSGVAEAVVVARDESSGEKRLVGYVVEREGERIDKAELRQSLQRVLPEYMVPSAIVVLEAMPLTANGKLDRRALPAPEWGTGEAGYEGPSTATEEMLAGIWGQVLGVERVGLRDNFFELGGHSLLAAQVMARVRTVLGVELPLTSIFQQQTLIQFAQEVDTQLQQQEMERTAILLEQVEQMAEEDLKELLRKSTPA
jgi:amino acid adenylation domain-containing protein